mmetsp:Transcript_7332/g.12923  ORF Transcript_7332/g.12923 Transcript_7332/m.12923 type:complete len:330 (+) Transcript_7332:116-1105(+)
MIWKYILLFIVALLNGHTSSAFVNRREKATLHISNTNRADSTVKAILQIRGGSETLQTALVSGTPLKAMGAQFAVASLTVLPITWYRCAYSFSVGYGLSVSTMSLALLSSFSSPNSNFTNAPSILALTALIYGIRLAAFIFVRERAVESKRKIFDELDKISRLKRTPLALGLSFLYACMFSPALFAFRAGSLTAGSVSQWAQKFSTSVAFFGMILEAVADQHKYTVKQRSGHGADRFVGPTSWSYRLCRHPNYLGEILQWVGIFGAGAVTFGKSGVAWICGVFGLWGILSLMLRQSLALDEKQSEKYGGQPAYEKWKETVTASVIPFIV